MKRNVTFSMVLLGFVAGLIQCRPSEMDPAPTGNDTTITIEERIMALERCETKAAELHSLTGIDDKIQFLAWLASQPEYLTFGFAGEDLFAVFKDGRLVFFLNTPLTDEVGGRSAATGRPQPQKALQSFVNARTEDLPKSKKVSLFNGMGRAFSDNTSGVEFIFAKAKAEYQVQRKVASIEELKAVSGDGVFYIFTHGGTGLIPSPTRPGVNIAVMDLWTTDVVNQDNEVRYKEDLDHWNLCYSLAIHDTDTPVKHYGITDGFIKEYMSFGENCLIYLDACNSFSSITGADAFREKIIAKATNKKATYLGWSAVTFASYTQKASQFIFDRLLGSNTEGLGETTIPKEDPKQRPFDLAQVFDDMHRNNIGVASNGAELLYKSTISDEILLRPTIESMEMDEYTSTLSIRGLFGWDQGKVSVNDVVVNITSWSPEGITCIIPETGDGSVGDVVVTSTEGVKSNVVPLTEWTIKLNYSSNDNGIKLTGACDLRFRADVHPRRSKIHEQPTKPTYPDYSPESGWIFNVKGSSAIYTITGRKYDLCSFNGTDCTVQYSESPVPKSGRVDYTIPNTSARLPLFALYNWGAEQKSIKISLIIINPPDTPEEVEERINCPGQPEVVIPIEGPYSAFFGFPTPEIEASFTLEIAENYNIRPGSFYKSIDRPWSLCSQTGKFEQTVIWSVVQPKYAPTDETPARDDNNIIGN